VDVPICRIGDSAINLLSRIRRRDPLHQ